MCRWLAPATAARQWLRVLRGNANAGAFSARFGAGKAVNSCGKFVWQSISSELLMAKVTAGGRDQSSEPSFRSGGETNTKHIGMR